MPSVLALYFSYLKSAVLVMVWAAVTFATYGFIRSSTVAEVIAAAAVSLVLSMAVALLLVDFLSPSHRVRRAVPAVFAFLLALLDKPRSHSGRKQEI